MRSWLALLVCLTGLCLAPPTRAAPEPPRRVGATEKICQLTGETDWATGRPTQARTLSRFGLDATDLGYPVEHDGKLLLLFGDTWPPPHGGGAAGEIPPDDAVGVSTLAAHPTPETCLDMRVHTEPPGRRFAPARVVGPARIPQGFFNVPSGGVSVGGTLFGFFWTGHCGHPQDLHPNPAAPLAPPPPSRDCPENAQRNSIGHGVMARSNDDARHFAQPTPLPEGFTYTIAVDAGPRSGLPEQQRHGVLVFGVPRYRASLPLLAIAPETSFANPATWRFFAGHDASGAPRFISHPEWQTGAGPGWHPPQAAAIVTPSNDGERCIGEFSVTYNHPLGAWLMLYNCGNGIWARMAEAPWGPWSAPAPILTSAETPPCALLGSGLTV